ncbi:MAG: ribonuclease H-like domain-containing protein, partial [Candidatus Aerophobus sp.]
INVGIRREKGLEDIDGYLAVILWRKYLEGDERALPALIRYNIEDVVNLKYLMEFGYNRMTRSFPIPIDHLQPGRAIKIDVPFDPNVVQDITGQMSWGS